MTKFVAYYNLCPIHDPKKFLGISPDQDEGNIITTLNKNIVIIIKISTQKQIKSWSVSEKLSAKVVFDKQSQRYVGVFGNLALRCWDAGCDDVNKCKKLKFKKSIADLVTTNDSTYVLYSDGSCELLAKAIESRKDQSEKAQNLALVTYPAIFNPKVFKLSNGTAVLTYFELDKATNDVVLVRLYVEDGHSGGPTRFKLSRPCQPSFELNPTGYAVIEGDDALMLLSIWSDNLVFMMKLDDSVEPESSPGKFVSRMSNLKVDSQMAVLGISKNFVAIYGANSGQEGSSLLLYNTKFHVVKTKQFFKVYLNFSRLWAVNQYILLAMGQNLSVVTYRQAPDLIADLLGTQVNNDFNSYIETEHINEEETLQENILFDNAKSTKITKQSTTAMELEETVPSGKFADGLTVAFEDDEEFNKNLSALSRLELSTRVVEVENAVEDLQIFLTSDVNDTGFVTPEVELIAQEMENCGASECEITEKLLTLLIRANLLSDIVICLRRYTNISDKMLVKVIKHVLDEYMEKNLKEIFATQSEGDEFSPSKNLKQGACSILNEVFACSFNSDSIAVHLRREIDYEGVVVIIDYLHNLLNECPDLTYFTRPTPEGSINDCAQFEMQILNWFSVLFSSHFQKLALSKDVFLIELLFKWKNLLSSYKAEVQELEELSSYLYNIILRKELKTEKTSKWYTIEEVSLW